MNVRTWGWGGLRSHRIATFWKFSLLSKITSSEALIPRCYIMLHFLPHSARLWTASDWLAPAAAAARVSHAVATRPDFHHPSHISPSSCFIVQHFIQCNEMLVLSSLAQTNKYPNQPTVCYIKLEGKEQIYFIFYTATTFIFFFVHRPGMFHFN